MYSDLIIFKKTYDLMLYLWPFVNKLPKTDKYVFGDKIKEINLEMIDNIIVISKYCNKGNIKEYLLKLDINKERLQIYIRMCYDLKHIDKRRYIYISGLINEIGKIIGGWIKKTN